ncbi:MAG: (Fe-S)-binding protein [Tepidisphaeraceae bacterium]
MSVPFLPESAPFSPEQRAWLNGFFAGIAGNAAPMNGNALPVAAGPAALPAPVEEEDFPWHDSALPLDERMTLAAGKKPERQLMAAMAQLDCGSCGYVCQTYAEAIATGTDKDLTKCSPGGKETATKLKELYVTLNIAAGPAAPAATPVAANPAAAGNDATRDNPWPAPLITSRRLSASDSAKEVRHVEFNLKGSSVNYKAGDALGVWPENCLEDVSAIIERLGGTGAEECHTIDGRDTSLFEALRRERVITKPTESLIELLIGCATDAGDREKLQAWLVAEHGEPLSNIDVLDVLMQVPSAKPKMNDFVGTLSKLQPRLYSISSSPNAHPNQVHLTVGAVRWTGKHGRTLRGVCSTYLADRVRPGERGPRLRPRQQKLRPARQWRCADHHGRAGHGHRAVPRVPARPPRRRREGPQLAVLRRPTPEPRLPLSRRTRLVHQRQIPLPPQPGLQPRPGRENLRAAPYARKRRGNVAMAAGRRHFYVCGDAQRMAKDVDDTLKKVVAEHGGMSDDDAKTYVSKMSKDGRYQRDVY